MKNKVILVWFRNDLRFHDNEVLYEAIEKNSIVIPVYCFDERYYKTNSFDNKNTGINRARFIRESVIEFKSRLQQKGSDLLVFKGLPEEILPKLAKKYEVDEVYHHREVASRETEISDKVETALWRLQINLKHFIGHTLFHKEDLPFPIREIPDSFNNFKKHAERESHVREPWPIPDSILSPEHLEKTEVPELSELGFDESEILQLNESTPSFKGGELAGLQALEKLLKIEFWDNNDYTLITPYIANGLVSPIYTYHKIKNSELVNNKKIYDKINEVLLWRDYYRFMLKKYPDIYFKVRDTEDLKKLYPEKLASWKLGNTGHEIIDKALTQLRSTGVISYALRKLIGTYLIQAYEVDWIEGASFFEECLLDYEPATNYGYWAHLAGEGTSKKENNQPNWKSLLKNIDPRALKKMVI